VLPRRRLDPAALVALLHPRTGDVASGADAVYGHPVEVDLRFASEVKTVHFIASLVDVSTSITKKRPERKPRPPFLFN